MEKILYKVQLSGPNDGHGLFTGQSLHVAADSMEQCLALVREQHGQAQIGRVHKVGPVLTAKESA